MPDNLCAPGCKICGGVGWIRSDAPVGDPSFGKLVPCPNAVKTRLPAFRKSGLNEPDFALSWKDVLSVNNVDHVNECIRNIVDRRYGFVYLWGGYGKGKTLILKTVVAEWLRTYERGAIYAPMTYVLEQLRHSYDTTRPAGLDQVMGMWEPETVPLLAIDEFDKITSTEFGNVQRFSLFDTRYELACSKSAVTLLASNLPPDGYDGYISDRLADGRVLVIEVVGRSVRSGMDY